MEICYYFCYSNKVPFSFLRTIESGYEKSTSASYDTLVLK